ncbi:MAG: AAA family ATPase [Pseudomonadota bacterium]
MSDQFWLFTGGPGTGKTTTLNMLANAGYPTRPEVARQIIQDQHAIGGTAHHQGDRATYLELQLSHEIGSFRTAAVEAGPVIFDRGLPDVAAYSLIVHEQILPHVTEACRRFRSNPTAFVFPPWDAIYALDAERKQDFAECLETDARCRQGYTAMGYKLVDVPFGSAKVRADFISETIKRA